MNTHSRTHTHTPHTHIQDEALKIMRSSALLAHDILQTCHASPPETLQSIATLLHDHCILVRVFYVCLCMCVCCVYVFLLCMCVYVRV